MPAGIDGMRDKISFVNRHGISAIVKNICMIIRFILLPKSLVPYSEIVSARIVILKFFAV